MDHTITVLLNVLLNKKVKMIKKNLSRINNNTYYLNTTTIQLKSTKQIFKDIFKCMDICLIIGTWTNIIW